MLRVKFYGTVAPELLKFAVIVAKSQGKWVFCQHRDRDTWELPGGHREKGEAIGEAARRELQEETGAVDFRLEPICVYSVVQGGQETFGMLYAAEILTFRELTNEIARIRLTDSLPEHWTYPLIQPHLLAEAIKRGYGSPVSTTKD